MIKEYLKAKKNILDFLRFSNKSYIIDFGHKIHLKGKTPSAEQVVVETLIFNCLEKIQEERGTEIYQIQKEIASLELKLAEIYLNDEVKILKRLLEEVDTKKQTLVVTAIK